MINESNCRAGNTSKEELQIMLEGELFRAKALHCLAKTLMECAEKAQNNCTSAITFLSGTDLAATDLDVENPLDMALGYKQTTRRLLDEIYKEAVRPSTGISDIPLDVSAERRQDFLKYSAPIWGIKAEFIGSRLVIQLPLLGSIWREKDYRSNSKKGSIYRYAHVFSEEVSMAVEIVLEEEKDIDLTSFQQKTLSFFFNYHSDSYAISDTDNHDIKAIIDAIIRHFPGSDTGPLCSIFLCTTVLDQLPIATFVVMTDGSFSPQNADVLKDFEPLWPQED